MKGWQRNLLSALLFATSAKNLEAQVLEKPGVRLLDNNSQYSLSASSEAFRQGDLIVLKLDPKIPFDDSTIRFKAKTNTGKSRSFTLPKRTHDGDIYALAGVDFQYPAQQATVEIEIKANGKITKTNYQLAIQSRSFEREYLRSSSTSNATATTPSQQGAVALENSLLIPSWQAITRPATSINNYQQPRPICNEKSFGSRRFIDGVEKSAHKGVDCSGKIGDPIVSALDGKIVLAQRDLFYMGSSTVVDHGYGLFTLYAHQTDQLVRVGENVKSGHQIGTIGRSGRATGPHLHLQAKLYGMNIDPLSLQVVNSSFR